MALHHVKVLSKKQNPVSTPPSSPQGIIHFRTPRPNATANTRLNFLLLNYLQEDLRPLTNNSAFFYPENRNDYHIQEAAFHIGFDPCTVYALNSSIGTPFLHARLDHINITIRIFKKHHGGLIHCRIDAAAIGFRLRRIGRRHWLWSKSTSVDQRGVLMTRARDSRYLHEDLKAMSFRQP